MSRFLRISIIFTIAMFLTNMPLPSQSLVLSNTETYKSGKVTDDELDSHCQITNTSAVTVIVKLQVQVTSLLQGHSTGVCYGVQCNFIPAGTELYEAPDQITLNAGQTSTTADFYGSIYSFLPPPNDPTKKTEGISKVRYIFSNESNSADNASYEFTAVFTTVSVKDPVPLLAVISVYPNPAREFVNFEFDINPLAKAARLDIFASDGSQVRSYDLSPGVNVLSIDINILPAGNYYYRLIVDGVAAKAKGFVVAY